MLVMKCLGAALILLALSCKGSSLKFIEAASYPNLKQERLGQSSYYVKFPPNMFIEEGRGKEGQLGYGLWQIDSLKRLKGYSGYIEIEPGMGIGRDSDNDEVVDKVRSNLLDGSVTWRITKTETGYFTAIANHGKLTLDASSLTRAGLDSMIAIIGTLSSR